jgi:hypothetical protein
LDFFLNNGKKAKIFPYSPDKSVNPLWAGVQPTKIETDSGTILAENA